ncbi:DUF4101 domain-containing protein [Pseudanabaena sp. FACHB-1998]|uniref:protein kinase domain-containing protein n=1 Tax=Pseudanabaena sp. FACHB-1998 TaxID=2692858 RepID=UPI001680383F|nr:protein kinase [Pseudanabaena sp. FACHB-1998]MBD2178338.1 DUF4101 domain-containing protein [Pseudanabaena sp. FACHB-1998]
MIGQLLDGRYRIANKLGEGGFGHTYLAHDTRIPNEPLCVVKHLKPASSDREYLKIASRLFTSEAQILAQLGNHDRLPRLLAYFDQAGEFYLVEEFIEGRSLELELVRGYRLPENQVIQILDDLLSILEYIHSHGVIHRDLKPDNIIRRKADGKLVLIDFGAIKQIQNQILQEAQTQATVAIGTVGYMPSEQAQGKPRPSSDLYAIGVICLQALTGLQPRELQEDYQTGELIWQHLVPNRSGLVDVLTKMTRYHYKDRYETASEVRQVLANLGKPSLPNSLPNTQNEPLVNGLQSTIVSTNSSNSSDLSRDLGTEVLPRGNSTPIPPTQVSTPKFVQPQPLVSPLPTPISQPQPTVAVTREPANYENLPQRTVQASTDPSNAQGYSNGSNNASNKGLWIAVWVGAFATAIAIGAVMATRNPSIQPIANDSQSPAPKSSPKSSAIAEPKAVASASSSPSPSETGSASPTPLSSPTSTPTSPAKTTSPIAPLSESEAVAIVNNLVASKNQLFAPPFDRQLLGELTTGEAYEKRKGSMDWLQSNNAFYRFGEYSVVRAGSFGIQDNQASVTVEISESPTLYVNGKIDRSQSQASKDRYICTLRFENGKWKVANLTKVGT